MFALRADSVGSVRDRVYVGSIGVGALAGPTGGFVAFALACFCVKLFEIAALAPRLGWARVSPSGARRPRRSSLISSPIDTNFFSKTESGETKKKRDGLRAETLGVCSEIELGRELKGRLAFQFLGATRIAATLSTGFAGAAAGLGGLRLLETVPLNAFKIAAYVVLGVLGVAVACAWRVGRAAVRFQGARHFGCGWKYAASFRAEAEQKLSPTGQERARSLLAQLQGLERRETARTSAILRAATEPTPSGVAMLRIAEAEAGVVPSCASVADSARIGTDDGVSRRAFESTANAQAKANDEPAPSGSESTSGETTATTGATATADEEFDAARRRLSRYDR